MYTIICGTVLAFVVAVLVLIREYRVSDYFDGVEAVLKMLIGVSLTALATIFFGLFMYWRVPTKDVTTQPVALLSATSRESVKGVFVLGSGTIHGERVFRFFIPNADGSFSPVEIPATTQTRIIEDDGLDHIGYWRRTTREDDCSSSRACLWSIGVKLSDRLVADELRVPRGTVQLTFELD